jgi:hypothetical protein
MSRLLLLISLCIGLPVQADIYKCHDNGQIHYQDKPCNAQSEKVEIKLHQPSKQDIEQQNKRTAAYNENSRIYQINMLKQENRALQKQKNALEKENKARYDELQNQTYDVGNGMIATRDPALLENMRGIVEQHVQQLKSLQQEIDNNKRQIKALSAKQ